MKNALWLLAMLLLVSGVSRGQSQSPSLIALTHVTVIDVTGAPLKRDMTVVIRGNRIAAIENSSKVYVPDGAQIVDARGKFLIPGLWDMHAHVFFAPNQSSAFTLYLANGVTGLRDMGGAKSFFDSYENKKREGQPLNGVYPAPLLLAAGEILDGSPPVHPTDIVVTNQAQAIAAVDERKREGADFIKVYSMLNRESYFAIIAEAKRERLPVAGHVPFVISAAEASEAGQKSIEHSDGILLAASTRETQLREGMLKALAANGYKDFFPYERANYEAVDSYSEEKASALFSRFVKNGTWVCPTLIVEKTTLTHDRPEDIAQVMALYISQPLRALWKQVDGYLASHRTVQDNAGVEKLYRKLLYLVGALHRAGVPLLAGTDIGNPYVVPGFSLHEELGLLVQAGLTPMQALQTATINPARYLGIEKNLGTIEEGKLADLVLLDANPLADIHNTTRIAAVFVNGQYLPRDALDQMLADVTKAVHSNVR